MGQLGKNNLYLCICLNFEDMCAMQVKWSELSLPEDKKLDFLVKSW